VQYGRERARRDSLIEAVAASERAASLADARYQAGAADFLASLVAQRTVLRCLAFMGPLPILGLIGHAGQKTGVHSSGCR